MSSCDTSLSLVSITSPTRKHNLRRTPRKGRANQVTSLDLVAPWPIPNFVTMFGLTCRFPLDQPQRTACSSISILCGILPMTWHAISFVVDYFFKLLLLVVVVGITNGSSIRLLSLHHCSERCMNRLLIVQKFELSYHIVQ